MSVNLKVSTIGTGKQLVFLHGWGVNSGVWEPLLSILKDSFCITTIDLPGYGLNQQNMPQDYNLHSVAQLVGQHIPINSTLIGWSLGGLIAQQIALDFPMKLTQLVLVCSSPKFAKDEGWPGIDPKVLDFFMLQLATDFNKTLDRFLAIQAMGSPCARQDIKTIKQAVQSHPAPAKEALVAGLKMLNNVDLRAQIKSLQLPCTLFLGGLDTLVPEGLEAILKQLAPQIKVEVFPKVSHAPFISTPQDFAIRLQKALI